jgi:hypothetical protein
VNWRREPKVVVKSLPEERKVLAERYTIDAEEAQRREKLAAESAARQAEADEVAGIAAAEEEARSAPATVTAEADRESHPEPLEPSTAPEPEPQLVLTPVADPPATEIAAGDEREQTLDLPIYRWFGNG